MNVDFGVRTGLNYVFGVILVVYTLVAVGMGARGEFETTSPSWVEVQAVRNIYLKADGQAGQPAANRMLAQKTCLVASRTLVTLAVVESLKTGLVLG